MGTKERRERELTETRELILSAAREMFAEKGFESVTMRAIADRIEYTPTAIYHHFASKQALLSELCEQDFDGLARSFVGNVTLTDPVERLKAIGNVYLRFAEEYPSQYRFMFMTVLPKVEFAEEHATEILQNPERNAYLFLSDTCRQAIETGRFRPEFGDPDQVAQILWGIVHGLVSLRITKHHAEFLTWRDLATTAHLAMDGMIRGMLRESKS
jgi:AcrR family transcriptional regulator